MSDGKLDFYSGMSAHEVREDHDPRTRWARLLATLKSEGWSDLCAELVRIGNHAALGLIQPESKQDKYMEEGFLQGELSAIRKIFGFLSSSEKSAMMESERESGARRRI